MAIPNDLTREDLILAMREFDDQIRDKQQRWSNWEQNRNHIYAIEYDGYKYPVKEIIRMAAGHADFGFYGGKGKYAANRFIENRNLTISLLREQQEPRNGTEVTTEQRSTRTPANYEFGLVAYFLSRYGTSDIDGNMNPPEILGTSTWIGSYALFYDALTVKGSTIPSKTLEIDLTPTYPVLGASVGVVQVRTVRQRGYPSSLTQS